MRVAQIGNFGSPHSTENELRRAFAAAYCEVTCYDEGSPEAWRALGSAVADIDLICWTRTKDLLDRIPPDLVADVVGAARSGGCPVVGYHLDRWWGLARSAELADPGGYHRLVDVMCTADGGSSQLWDSIGVRHWWVPPAVSAEECIPAVADRRWTSDVAFVGSWRGYHPEWPHRQILVEWLRNRYGDRVRFWPEPRRHAVRGDDLRALYASVRVVVGDSCLLGSHYWSDRIPETLGRGAYLAHPWVEGLDEHYTPGQHLACWSIGDWDGLARAIDEALADEDMRRTVAEAGRAHVLAHHTYTHRVQALIERLSTEGLLRLR